MTIAFRVPGPMISAAMPTLMSLLERAVEMDPSRDTNYICENILSNKFSPWIVIDEADEPIAAGVTKIDQIGSEKHLTILYCGGGKVPWSELIEEVEAHAIEEGCASVRIEGRNGWAKVLKSNGYINKPFLEKRL